MTKKSSNGHDMYKDVCVTCKRHGADLSIPCPGYATAGELVKWKPRPVAHMAKKKGAKR